LFRPVPPQVEQRPQSEQRHQSLILSHQANRHKSTQEFSPSSRRQNTGGLNNFFSSIRHRTSPKTSISSASTADSDQNLSSSVPHTNYGTAVSNSIPIKPHQPAPTSSSSLFYDYSSSSLLNRSHTSETSQQTTKQPTDFTVPLIVPSKKLWISDDEVSVCMCCNETQFSMFNRRHHCRRCGRVVCKPCSQYETVIKNRRQRTCKDCYQQLQNSPTPTTNPRPEPTNPTKKFDSFRP
jgi:hypothetical protein